MEQEMFCCAVARGRGPKVHWLHTCAHDYWEKYQNEQRELFARVTTLRLALRGLLDHDPGAEDAARKALETA